MKNNNMQRNFFGKLFAKPKKPISHRLQKVRSKIKQEIDSKNISIGATQNYIEINKSSMGSSERLAEERDLNSMKNRVSNLEKRLKKVNKVEKSVFEKRIFEAHNKRKILVFPEKTLRDKKSKNLMVKLAKSITLFNLINVCSERFNQDWEIISSMKKDILKREYGKPNHFVYSSNRFLHNLYRISQELVIRGNTVQKQYGLELFIKLERIANELK
ncbi:MAG: hypothetical protein PHP82_00805 [Candidatus ainarchaeum sp.]|nr:hypothetical protein [Candidatus ainarchaeum sp.]